MAGAGYKLFNTGDVLTAAQVNTYLNEQTVMVFANSTARTTALSGVLAEGMMSYLQDTNAVEVYNGTSWVNVGNAGDITEVQAGTGISVASGTGPIPVITNTVATAFDAAGDLVYGTGADTFTKLSLGTAGKVLTVNSGATAPEWATPAGISWTTWSPTYSNLTIGNGTVVARYAYSGGLVVVQWQLTWGSTTSFTGAPTISNLPYNVKNRGAGFGYLQAANVNYPWFVSLSAGSGSFSLYAINASGTYAGQTALSNTVPGSFSNAQPDYLGIYFTYEAN